MTMFLLTYGFEDISGIPWSLGEYRLLLFFSSNPYLLAHLPTEFCIPPAVSNF